MCRGSNCNFVKPGISVDVPDLAAYLHILKGDDLQFYCKSPLNYSPLNYSKKCRMKARGEWRTKKQCGNWDCQYRHKGENFPFDLTQAKFCVQYFPRENRVLLNTGENEEPKRQETLNRLTRALRRKVNEAKDIYFSNAVDKAKEDFRKSDPASQGDQLEGFVEACKEQLDSIYRQPLQDAKPLAFQSDAGKDILDACRSEIGNNPGNELTIGAVSGVYYERLTARFFADNKIKCFNETCKREGTIQFNGGSNTSWQDFVCSECGACYEMKTKDGDFVNGVIRNPRLGSNGGVTFRNSTERVGWMNGGHYKRYVQQTRDAGPNHFLLVLNRKSMQTVGKMSMHSMYCGRILSVQPRFEATAVEKYKRGKRIPVKSLVYHEPLKRWIDVELDSYEQAGLLSVEEVFAQLKLSSEEESSSDECTKSSEEEGSLPECDGLTEELRVSVAEEFENEDWGVE